jgi:hypothetical protein
MFAMMPAKLWDASALNPNHPPETIGDMTMTRVEKIHAKLARQRDEAKSADPTIDLPDVIELMDRAIIDVSKIGDNHDLNADQLDRLESARHSAIKLHMDIDAIFDALNGRS